jgi:4-hydroxybenzoate polyprenyltransferase
MASRCGDGWVRRFDAVALLRPTLLIPLWTMQLLGAAHASRVGWPPAWTPGRDFLVLATAHTLLVGAIYVLNQMADADADLRNRKLFLVPHRLVSSRFLWTEVAVLLAPALLLLVFRQPAGPAPAHVAALLLSSLAMGAAYSVRPVRLKARAGLDLAANAVGYGIIAFGVGWLSVAPLSRDTWATALPYALSVGACFAFTTIPDIPGDAANGDATLGVVLGARRTARLGILLLLAACAASFAVGNYVALTAIVPATAAYGVAERKVSRKGSDPHLTRTTQIVILALSLIAAFCLPLYLPWLAVVVGWTRWYHAKRFGVRYP